MSDPAGPPPLFRLIGEAESVREWWAGREHLHDLEGPGEVPEHSVLVLPGFLASDWMTAPLRRALAAAGYDVHGWGLGRNLGLRPGLFERLEARIVALSRSTGHPVILVGWSLGGLYARELAKRHSEHVAKVITLGSPFSGDIRANHAWRLYELLAGHSVDRPPMQVMLSEKPPVPTTAIWSLKDGIVAPDTARGLSAESDMAVEVDCTHLGLICAPCAIDAVLKALQAVDPPQPSIT